MIAEPAREIISELREINGDGIYDRNPYLFKELMLSRMKYNYKLHDDSRAYVIFDSSASMLNRDLGLNNLGWGLIK